MPDADERQDHRQVLVERRGAEMVVHRPAAGEEGGEIGRADGDHQRQADRRPDRVAAADPVPEAEGPVVGDAEGGDLVERRRHRREMGADRRARPKPRRSRRRAVAALVMVSIVVKVFEATRNSVRAGSRLGKRVADVGAVDIRDEMSARPIVEGAERAGRHARAEVRAADADIDDVGERARRFRRSRPSARRRRSRPCGRARRGPPARRSCRRRDRPRPARRAAQHGGPAGSRYD